MLMTIEEARDYIHIMTEEGYKETVANKRETWQETDCIIARAKQSQGNTKKGDMITNRGAMYQARNALTETDGPPTSGRNQCCHLCKNDSSARNGFVCVNPNHLYWGSRRDNKFDQSPESKSASGKIGGKAGGKVTCAIERTCPHCSKTGRIPAMFQWHFDRCKLKK